MKSSLLTLGTFSLCLFLNIANAQKKIEDFLIVPEYIPIPYEVEYLGEIETKLKKTIIAYNSYQGMARQTVQNTKSNVLSHDNSTILLKANAARLGGNVIRILESRKGGAFYKVRAEIYHSENLKEIHDIMRQFIDSVYQTMLPPENDVYLYVYRPKYEPEIQKKKDLYMNDDILGEIKYGSRQHFTIKERGKASLWIDDILSEYLLELPLEDKHIYFIRISGSKGNNIDLVPYEDAVLEYMYADAYKD